MSKFPHEMESYKRAMTEVQTTADTVQSFRDRVFDFTVETGEGDPLILHFLRLRRSQWRDISAEIRALNIPKDPTQTSEVSKEQLDGLYRAQCKALGCTSADDFDAKYFEELDSDVIVTSCFRQLLDVSGLSEKAQENMSWFQQQQRRQDARSDLPTDGQVPARAGSDANGQRSVHGEGAGGRNEGMESVSQKGE